MTKVSVHVVPYVQTHIDLAKLTQVSENMKMKTSARPLLDASLFPHFHVFGKLGSVSKEQDKNANVLDCDVSGVSGGQQVWQCF